MTDRQAILVVDDTLDSLRVVTEMLSAEDYEVRPADGGALALVAVLARPPALILLDVRMPAPDGFEVCRQLKADPSTHDIPVIFLSASTDVAERVEGLRLGAVDFVSKPVQRDELLARVRTHLELSSLRRNLEHVVLERTAALRESLGRLSLANDLARLGYWEYEPATDRCVLEAGFRRRFLVPPMAEPKLAEFAACLPSDAATSLTRALEAALQHGPDVGQLEHAVVRADGSEGYALVRFTVVRDERGVAQRIYGANQDITDCKQAEQALEALRQEQKIDTIGRLAGGVAHDFNNLLTVILGHLDLLAGAEGAERRALHIREAIAATTSAAALTRQLLLFARKQPATPQTVQVNDVVLRTHRMLARLIGEDIELAVEVDPTLPKVRIDPSHLEQVLLNLAVNARDAMPSGGRLSIATRLGRPAARERSSAAAPPHDEALVALQVTDTGCGMDAATLAQIFEPFFTTKDKGKGTGIGLLTVQGVVKQAGGFIEVESEPGRGTRFSIYLPPCTEQLPESEPLKRDVLPVGQGARIVLVEDQAGVRELAKKQLELLGYEVVACTGGRDALSTLAGTRDPIDLILSDIVLQDMDGPALVERVRQSLPELPALYMSGYANERTLNAALGARLLAKPFSMRELAEAVHESLVLSAPRRHS